MMDPLRVAMVTETWLPSINGVVTRLRATVAELTRRGHRVLVVAPRASDRLPGVLEVPAVGVPFIYGGQPWGLPLPRVSRALRAFRPSLIHAVNPVLLGWAGIVHARRHRLPLVCSYHTRVATYARYYHLGFAERLADAVLARAHRMADLNLVTSQVSADQMERWGATPVRLWPGSVDLDRFRPRAPSLGLRQRLTGGHPERMLSLYVGRLAAEKGVERLLPLAEPGSRRHLALIGDGPARKELGHAFAGSQATFAGAMQGEELAEAFATGDLLAFPSTTDTLGLVLLEAAAAGLPVVAVRSPAAEEVLRGLEGVALVPPGDGRGLVAAAERLGGLSVAERSALAARARDGIPSWARSTDLLVGYYREAIARSLSRWPGSEAGG